MRCGYFDCFSGAAGDMLLGALVHAGVSLDALSELVARLNLPGVTLRQEPVTRGGLTATQVHVVVGPASRTQHRHLPDIINRIEHAGLSPRTRDRAARVFQRLATAEAAVHGIPVEKVHFHEVGAADAIVDIVGTCVGLELLAIERIVCSPIPTGSGTVICEHGTLPVPAPATAELLRGVPLAACDEPAELTTPTGAALLTTLADSYGPMPPMQIQSIGYGAGQRELQSRPNLLRLIVGELIEPSAGARNAAQREVERRDAAERDVEGRSAAEQDANAQSAAEQDVVIVLEAQIDDAPGQNLAFACERLLAAGALDAYLVPIVMKKGRPGQVVTVLARPADVAALEAILFAETTTFGIRRHECPRSTLAREHVTVQTPFGPLRVKVGRQGGQVVRAWPEYEDCAAAARQSGVALRTVQEAALQAWTTQHDDRHGGHT